MHKLEEVQASSWGLSVHLPLSSFIAFPCLCFSLALPFFFGSSRAPLTLLWLVRLCSDLGHLWSVFLFSASPFSSSCLAAPTNIPPTHTHTQQSRPGGDLEPVPWPPSLFSLGPRLPLDHSCQLPLASPSLEFFPRPSQSAVRVHDLAIPAPFLTSHQETSPNSPERVSRLPPLQPRPGSSRPQGPLPPPPRPPARPFRLQGWAGSRRTHSCKLGVLAGLDPRTPPELAEAEPRGTRGRPWGGVTRGVR